MKTAISVPDAVFRRVEERVSELGVSRSEFFSTAAARYLDELDRASLTARINEAIGRAGDAARREERDSALLSTALLARYTADDDW